MKKAVLIGNRQSASGHRLDKVDVPGQWILNPATVTADDLLDVDLIAFFGGDGTMQITLSQILDQIPGDRLPPIALLPFGTTNMNARDLNNVKSRRASVASLRKIVRSGIFHTVTRPLVRVVDGDQTQHGFFFGAGVIADVVKQWNEGRKPGPVANQLRSLQAMVTGLTTVSSTSEVVLNGKALSIYGLLVTTLDRLLFGSRPYWGQTDPGSLKITWVEAAAEHLLRHAPALLRGRSSLADRKGFESHRIDRATLELEGPYIIDGEIFEPRNRILNIETSHPIRWIRL